MRHFLVTMFVLVIFAGFAVQPAIAEYPEKPIELVIHMPAGSAPDIEGRVFAQEMSKVLGKPLVPINKPGGGGAVAYTYVHNAKPDGYTISWNSMSILTSTNIGNVPFDVTGFEHVGQMMTQPMIVICRYDAKWKNAKELVEDAKKNPGTIKMSSASIGSSTHLVTIAFMQYADIDAVLVPLGSRRMIPGILAGEVDTATSVSSNVIDLYKAKKLRVLFHSGVGKMAPYPDAVSMQDMGYDVVLELFRGVSLPKGTPAEVKTKLWDAMQKVAKTKAMANLSAKTGLEIKLRDSADFTDYLMKRDKQIKEILKKANLYRSKK